jgi:hypothetical protein
MEKHISLVGILNIVYRSIVILEALVLFVLGLGFGRFFSSLLQSGDVGPHEVPLEVLNIIPIVLLPLAMVMAIVSVAGIIGAIGVLQRKQWGRILLLVVSFVNLLRVPLGTALAAYSIWVLMNDETIRLFGPAASTPALRPTA